MYKIQYFDIHQHPILGIKRITVGFFWLNYSIERNPITNKKIRSGLYIKYITHLINRIKNNKSSQLRT